MRLGYTLLYVPDVTAAITWWEGAFGLSRRFIHEGGDYGELSTGETRLAFSARALMRQLGKNPEPAVVERPTIEIALETDDVHASFQRAVDHGARSVMQPTDQPWGQTISYVADLDGYLVEICSPVQLPSAG